LLQLLKVWPQVKRLSVSGTIPYISTPIAEPLIFKDLESLSITAQTPPFIIVLQRLIFDALGTSLRELHLGLDTDSEVLDRLNPSTLSSVQVLSIPSYGAWTRDVVKKCSSLRRLKIERPVSCATLSDYLPKTLETLSISAENAQHLRSLSSIIPLLHNLRELRVRPCALIDYQGLSNLCRSKGVELTICRTNTQFEDF